MVAAQTIYAWEAKSGRTAVSDAKRLRDENAGLNDEIVFNCAHLDEGCAVRQADLSSGFRPGEWSGKE
jgi:hypothetical protein